MFSSQSVQIDSQTSLFLILETASIQMYRSEEWTCSQNALHNNLRVVENLTLPQIADFFKEPPNPNLFFPRVGLFTADFALGTVLTQK